MKTKIIVILAILLLITSGCGKTEEVKEVEINKTKEAEQVTEEAEQIVLGAEDMKGVDFAPISEGQLPSSLKEKRIHRDRKQFTGKTKLSRWTD